MQWAHKRDKAKNLLKRVKIEGDIMGTLLGKLGKAAEVISEAVFPSNIYCICCGSLIDGSRAYSLCDECIRKFHWTSGRTCEKCGKALPQGYRGRLCYDCMDRAHYFTKGYSCLTYGLHERAVLLDYKYNGKGYLAKKLGDMLYDRMSCEDLQVDLIIPVPLSDGRKRQRGYNQSELMVRRLSALWGVPWDGTALRRKKETPRLRSLNPSEREMALFDAFAVLERDAHKIKDKRLLLVDDIYTTGATADACSKALLSAGAGEVYFLSLASGGNRRPKDVEAI